MYLNEIYLLDEISLLNEDLSSFIKKLTVDKAKLLLGKVSSAIKRKDSSLLKKLVAHVPTVTPDLVKKLVKGEQPTYDRSFAIAKKYIETKFPKVPTKSVDALASVVAILSGSDVTKTKDNLRKLSIYYDKHKTKFGIREDVGDWVIGLVLVGGVIFAVITLIETGLPSISLIILGIIIALIATAIVSIFV